MVKKYVRWLVFGIVVAILAAGGFYWTLGGSDDGGQQRIDQRPLRSDEKPIIQSPGKGLNDPERVQGTSIPDLS